MDDSEVSGDESDGGGFDTPDPQEFLDENSPAKDLSDGRDAFNTPDLDDVLEENQDADELASVDGRPLVPEGVLRGIEDLLEGRTASFSEIQAVLKS